MNKVLKYVKKIGIWVLIFLIYFVLLALFSYNGVFKLSTVGTINMVMCALTMFILGVKFGKKASKRGYLEGLKIGGIVVLSLFLLNLIFYRVFNLYIFLYYLLILASSTIGSMIGINTKR